MFLDALYEHPLEALYGALVLVAPLFLFPVSLYGYLVFFAVVGVHEIVDHSGIDIDLPLLSRSRHHDDHHRRSNCYYGQLLPVLDRAHGSILVEDRRLTALAEGHSRTDRCRRAIARGSNRGLLEAEADTCKRCGTHLR